jgi:dTDP-glucose 4,6-dehydratase
MKSILVTGGAGFIGSNFIPYYLKTHPDVIVINLDKLTYAGNLDNLKAVENENNYRFVKGDICDRKLVEKILEEFSVCGIIHFAAESHVDNSIEKPEEFIVTNVMGTFTLLDAAKKFWMNGPFRYKEKYSGCRFHHVSTDEVYGALGDTGLFTEKSPYAPNSPYSASKAGSDMIVRSYHHTFGMDTVITNCSNNYGPKQHDEKLIPTIIRNALAGKPIPVYGKGDNIRDWLYVEDHCRAIDLVFQNGKPGETYNIGTRNELKNIDLVKKICRRLDEIKPIPGSKRHEDLVEFVKDRPGHDNRYAIDPSKIEKELGYGSCESFDSGLRKTIDWYVKKYEKNI